MAVYPKGRDKSGRTQWRVVIWHKGKRHDWIITGKKSEASTFEAERRLALKAGEPLDIRIAPLFSVFCTGAYADRARVHLRDSTRSVRKYQLATLVEHFGPLKLTEIHEVSIEAFKKHRREQDNVRPSTVNGELNALSAVLSHARELGVPCSRPKISRCPEKKRKGRLRFFTRDEVGFILTATKLVAPELFPLVLFLFETGVRKSEALNLAWPNVDLDAGMANIWSETDAEEEEDTHDREEGDDVPYEVKSVEREVTLSNRLCAVLREHRTRCLSNALVFPVWKDNAGTKGERYANFPKHTWARILAKATELARRVSPEARTIRGGPHKARHTYASHFLKEKPDLFLLGRVLGHSHAKVTELYSHLLPEHLAEARNVVTFDDANVDESEIASSPDRAPDRAQLKKKRRPASRESPLIPSHHNVVGAIGVEPTTPTVSKQQRPVSDRC